MPHITYIQHIQPLVQLLFKISVQNILTVVHSALPVWQQWTHLSAGCHFQALNQYTFHYKTVRLSLGPILFWI